MKTTTYYILQVTMFIFVISFLFFLYVATMVIIDNPNPSVEQRLQEIQYYEDLSYKCKNEVIIHSSVIKKNCIEFLAYWNEYNLSDIHNLLEELNDEQLNTLTINLENIFANVTYIVKYVKNLKRDKRQVYLI